MRTERMAAWILALCVMLAAQVCFAESIFDILPEEDAEAARLTAPSYSSMAGVEPDQVEPSAEGGTIVTYRNVSAADVNRFGVYLGRMGYGVTRQEDQEEQTGYAVSDGRADFVMFYDRGAHTMRLVYPGGTDYAEALFPEYRRIEFN